MRIFLAAPNDRNFWYWIDKSMSKIESKNNEERLTRVPRLTDIRYSVKGIKAGWRYASSKAILSRSSYLRQTGLSIIGVRVAGKLFFWVNR